MPEIHHGMTAQHIIIIACFVIPWCPEVDIDMFISISWKLGKIKYSWLTDQDHGKFARHSEKQQTYYPSILLVC